MTQLGLLRQQVVAKRRKRQRRTDAVSKTSTITEADPEQAKDLSELNRKELVVFSSRAMGLDVGVGDIKNVPSLSEIKTVVATGINKNGHLCAEITDIRPLQISGTYEVTCVANRGGSAKKAYVLEALKGVAFEQ